MQPGVCRWLLSDENCLTWLKDSLPKDSHCFEAEDDVQGSTGRQSRPPQTDVRRLRQEHLSADSVCTGELHLDIVMKTVMYMHSQTLAAFLKPSTMDDQHRQRCADWLSRNGSRHWRGRLLRAAVQHPAALQ